MRKFASLLMLLLLHGAGAMPLSRAAQGVTVLPPGGVLGEGRAFVEMLVREDFTGASKNFDATMKATFPPEKLQELWKTVKAQAGAFKRVDGVRSEKSAQFDVVIVTCEFEKTGVDIKVVFTPERQITGLFLAPAIISSGLYERPAYVRVASFQQKEAVVGSGEWALPGTLLMPVKKGLLPAVVLVHGSGPNDRDETIGENRPFRDIAEGLASQGIAVLRYDKRTKTHGAKLGSMANTFTVKEEVIDDAVAAVALLRKTEGIDPRRIYVVGHSLGATLAPRIARADPQIAGLILMAAASRPVEDLLVGQFAYVFSLDGTISTDEQARLDQLKRQVAKLKDPATGDSTPVADMPLGIPAHYWLSLRGYKAAEDARTLKQPMLVLQGERDYQVTLEDFAGWKILSTRKDVTLKSYPKLNHLFIEGEGKSAPSEYSKTGNVAKYVVDDIAAWIAKN